MHEGLIQPHNTALLLFHYQNDSVHPDGKLARWGMAAMVEEKGLLRNSRALLDWARMEGLLVVYFVYAFRKDLSDVPTNSPLYRRLKESAGLIEGTWGAEIHPSVRPRHGEPVIKKPRIGAFTGTELDELLRSRAIDTLVLAGITTNWVIESTARHAIDLGYKLVAVEDCMASLTQALHDFAIQNIYAEIGTVVRVCDLVRLRA